MFKDRFISSVVLVVIALFSVMMGGPILAILSAIISVIGMFELYRIQGIEKKPLGIVGYCGAALYYILLCTDNKEYLTMLVFAMLAFFLADYVFTFPKYKANQVMHAFFGFFYVAILLSYIYQTRTIEHGIYIVWLTFISSWICDTCAYCVGVLFGRHKMAPILSPKKSIEGAIGGLAGSGIVGYIFGLGIHHLTETPIDPLVFAIICMVGALVSMVGDLAASGIKRDYNVKDYGNIIPGHGGILDRFDSLIFTAPIIYYMALYLM